MRFKLPIISWLNSKYSSANAEKKNFKLKATFSERINFIVKYPITEKHSLIKEFTQNDWEEDIAVIDPSSIYLKVFITNINIIKQCNITLELLHLENGEVVASNIAKYNIDKGLNNNEWLMINWSEIEIDQFIEPSQNITITSNDNDIHFKNIEIEMLSFLINQIELSGFSTTDELNFKLYESFKQFEVQRKTLREFVKEINAKYYSIYKKDDLLIFKQKDLNDKRQFRYLISKENIILLKESLVLD